MNCDLDMILMKRVFGGSPAANAARRSSLPSVRVTPTVNSASARY